MSSDLKDFLEDITWYFRSPQEIVVLGERRFQCSEEFENKFPVLSILLKRARITLFQDQEQRYELFGWTDHDGKSIGWLCFAPLDSQGINKELHPDHSLLLQNFGGITERWNEPWNTWLLNLHYALPFKYAETGFNGWEDSFLEFCEEEGIEVKINPSDYIVLAVEANGNSTMYHKETGEVLMYAHDHAFDHIYPLDHYPEYTLYRIKDCLTFRDWVETIAHQWSLNVKE